LARIDKWLWAARFFKTRSLAQRAIEGGKIKLAGERIKPSREVKPGDALSVAIGDHTWDITVVQVSDKRGPAPVARLLYEESEESRARREAAIAKRRLTIEPAHSRKGRPTKRERRELERFETGEG
jgi:ribosome-associated heat shock protein Hsp15